MQQPWQGPVFFSASRFLSLSKKEMRRVTPMVFFKMPAEYPNISNGQSLLQMFGFKKTQVVSPNEAGVYHDPNSGHPQRSWVFPSIRWIFCCIFPCRKNPWICSFGDFLRTVPWSITMKNHQFSKHRSQANPSHDAKNGGHPKRPWSFFGIPSFGDWF